MLRQGVPAATACPGLEPLRTPGVTSTPQRPLTLAPRSEGRCLVVEERTLALGREKRRTPHVAMSTVRSSSGEDELDTHAYRQDRLAQQLPHESVSCSRRPSPTTTPSDASFHRPTPDLRCMVAATDGSGPVPPSSSRRTGDRAA